jgi:hypothetical protein
MTRRLLLAAAGVGILSAQSGIGPPLAGYMRDSWGNLCPVYGVFGNLVVGEPIARGVVEALFSGTVGLARTENGTYVFDASGRFLGRVPAARRKSPPLALVAEGEELVFRGPGGVELRTRVEGIVLGIERMGETWFQVHQAGRRLAVRAIEDRLEVCTLPERSP